MGDPPPATHETLGNPPIAYVAQQSVASLQAGDLIEHLLADADRAYAGLSCRERVGQSKEVGKTPRMIVVKQQPVAHALLVHPAAKPEDFRADQNLRPRPQHHALKLSIGDFDYAVAAAAKHFGIAGKIGDGMKDRHRGRSQESGVGSQESEAGRSIPCAEF